MTNLTTFLPGSTYGDLLTTTNNGQGLSATLNPLQDGKGTNSTVTIATDAINFSRAGGNTFQLDGTALTASVAALNAVGATTFPRIYESDANHNMFIGNLSGNTATTGTFNLSIGINDLQALTSGSANFAFGTSNLNSLTTGTGNVSVGNNNFSDLTIGAFNVGVGDQIADTFLNLNYSLFLGSGATASADNLTNIAAIGPNAIVSTSNSIVLGGVVVGEGCNVGIGTSSPAYTLDICNVNNGVHNFCVLYLQESLGVPATPAGGGILYVNSGGGLVYVSPAGTSTVIGPA